MIIETFVAYFTFSMPTNPLPGVKIGHPQREIALATAAVSNFLSSTFY